MEDQLEKAARLLEVVRGQVPQEGRLPANPKDADDAMRVMRATQNGKPKFDLPFSNDCKNLEVDIHRMGPSLEKLHKSVEVITQLEGIAKECDNIEGALTRARDEFQKEHTAFIEKCECMLIRCAQLQIRCREIQTAPPKVEPVPKVVPVSKPTPAKKAAPKVPPKGDSPSKEDSPPKEEKLLPPRRSKKHSVR